MKKVTLLLVCLMMVFALAACPTDDGEPESLQITPPTHLTYIVGTADKIDLAGGKVAVKYSKGKVKDEVALDHADVTIMPYSLDVVGTVPIEVRYKELKKTFDVEVVAPEGISEVTVSAFPYKTSYGVHAKVANVETRGGKLTVKFSDDRSDAVVPFTHPDVTVHKIDHITKKISMMYKGIIADYEFEEAKNEVAYVTFTSLPTKTTFRDNATERDVDFTGATVTLEVGGSKIGTTYNLATWGRVNATDIDLTAEYPFVTFERDLLNFDGFNNYTVVGTFDISVESEWVKEVEVKDAPPAKADPVLKLGGYDLAGGTATLKYTNKSGADVRSEEVSLTDERFSIVEFSYDEKDINVAHFTLKYEDKIATVDKILFEIDAEFAEGSHTAATIIEYYKWVLPTYSSGIWSRLIEFSDDQIAAADAVLARLAMFTPDEKIDFKDEIQELELLVYYRDRYVVYNESFDRFDELVENYRTNRTDANKALIIEKAEDINELVIDFAEKYQGSHLEPVVLYEATQVDPATNEEVKISVKLEVNMNTVLNYSKNNLSPYLDTENNVFTDAEYLRNLFVTNFGGDKMDDLRNDDKKSLTQMIRSLDADDARAKAIVKAYELISNEDKQLEPDLIASGEEAGANTRLPTSAKLFTYLLTGDDWFPEALDIVYAYYYDPSLRPIFLDVYENAVSDNAGTIAQKIAAARYVSATNNSIIFNMLQDGVISPIIAETAGYVASPLQALSISDNIGFLVEYEKYVPLTDKIKNYEYSSTREVLWAHRTIAYIDQNAIPSEYNKDAKPGYKSNQLEHWLEAINEYYDEVLYMYYGELITGANFKAFFPKYSAFFSRWTGSSAGALENPYPVGNTEFNEGFEEIYKEFNKLTFAEQGAFIYEIDRSVARELTVNADNKNNPRSNKHSTSFFGMMLESYLKSNVTEGEYNLHLDVFAAYSALTKMAYDGISVEQLNGIFLPSMLDATNAYRTMGNTSTACKNYTEKLFEACRDSYTSLSKIGKTEEGIIENLYLALNYLSLFRLYSTNDLYGFLFLTFYDDLVDEINAWCKLKDLTPEDLKEYKIGAVSVYDQYQTLIAGYEEKYLSDIQAGQMEMMFKVGKAFARSRDYIKAEEFEDDIIALIEEYDGLETPFHKFIYLSLSTVVLANVFGGRYNNFEATADEIKLFSTSFINYFVYLIFDVITDEDYREWFGWMPESDIETDEDRKSVDDYNDRYTNLIKGYFESMPDVIKQYEAIVENGGIKSETDEVVIFEGMNLTGLYNRLLARYNTLKDEFPELYIEVNG